jgi:hypothetical protein
VLNPNYRGSDNLGGVFQRGAHGYMTSHMIISQLPCPPALTDDGCNLAWSVH